MRFPVNYHSTAYRLDAATTHSNNKTIYTLGYYLKIIHITRLKTIRQDVEATKKE